MTTDNLLVLLKSLEANVSLNETAIYEALEDYRQNSTCSEKELEAERIAFAFLENEISIPYPLDGVNTVFKPCINLNHQAQGALVFPNLGHINADTVQYWAMRMEDTRNLVFKARYAGLLWDFCTKYTQQFNKQKINFAQVRIDAVVDMIEAELHKNFSCTLNIKIKLKHALILAMRINNSERINVLKKTILNYESSIKGDLAVDAWSISYNLLLRDKKIKLSTEEEIGIITRISDRLENLVNPLPNRFEIRCINVIREASCMLAEYYQKKQNKAEITLILDKYLRAVLQQSEQSTSAIASNKILQEAHDVMEKYNQHAYKETIIKKLQTIGSKLISELKPTSIKIRLDMQSIDLFVEKITQGNLKDCLCQLIDIPQKSDTSQQLQDLIRKFPIQFLFQNCIIDNEGRTTTIIQPPTSDEESHIIKLTAQNLKLSALIERLILEKIFRYYSVNTEILIEHFYQYLLFNFIDKKLLEHSLAAYLKFDVITFLHVIIPQIENMLRCYLKQKGQAVTKHTRNGGFNYLTFDELLRHKEIENSFGKEICFYFRVVFTDARGLNLRNDVCHGIFSSNQFTQDIADIVFIALLTLTKKIE